jgi:hypothetical protein
MANTATSQLLPPQLQQKEQPFLVGLVHAHVWYAGNQSVPWQLPHGVQHSRRQCRGCSSGIYAGRVKHPPHLPPSGSVQPPAPS